MSSNPLLSREDPEHGDEVRGAAGSPRAGSTLPGGAAECSPLFLEGWLEFNRVKWGVQPFRWRSAASGANSAQVEAVFYLDQHGRIVLPRLNPYLPVAFRPTAARSPIRISRQWHEAAEPLVREICERRLGTTVMLPPEILDARPWIWAGFQVGVRYTFYHDLPLEAGTVDPEVRRKCQRARNAGYTCERSQNLADALACVRETERRQGFTFGLTEHDLEQLTRLLGEECFRVYVCYSPNGQPISARLILHSSDGRAMDWVCGTAVDHLQTGATQLLIGFVIEDLQAAGAHLFDFSGANIRSIATAKMNWGGQLVPYYTLQADYNFRTLAKWLYDWLRYGRTGKQPRSRAFRADVPSPDDGSVGLGQSSAREDARD